MEKRWNKGLLAVIVAVGTIGAGVVPNSATAAVAGPAGISWSECKPGGVEQCGKLTVPLDWAKPAGAKIQIAVARVPAKDQQHKLGSLMFNPGGPGGPGALAFAQGQADKLFTEYRDRYDLVSFDPRGAGGSSKLDCGPVLRPGVPVFPKNKGEYDAMVASSRATGEQCLKQHGELMRNLDTRTAARDMDAFRAALGDDKLNYLGVSYGSYLGTTYAQLFPRRVGRMVLDGILDHAQGPTALMLAEAKEMEKSFDKFASWCDQDSACALHGQDAGAVWDKVVAKADRTPLQVPGYGSVTGDVMRMSLPSLLPRVDRAGDVWGAFAQAIALADKGDGSLFAELTYVGDPGTEYVAVSCMDFPGELMGYSDAKARIDLAKKIAPRVGASVEAWAITAACAGWPIKPSNPWQPTPLKGIPPILITSTMVDGSTPLSQAKGLARQVQGSHLLVANAYGHTTFYNASCAQDAMVKYLVDGQLPPKRSTCG